MVAQSASITYEEDQAADRFEEIVKDVAQEKVGYFSDHKRRKPESVGVAAGTPVPAKLARYARAAVPQEDVESVEYVKNWFEFVNGEVAEEHHLLVRRGRWGFDIWFSHTDSGAWVAQNTDVYDLMRSAGSIRPSVLWKSGIHSERLIINDHPTVSGWINDYFDKLAKGDVKERIKRKEENLAAMRKRVTELEASIVKAEAELADMKKSIRAPGKTAVA